MLELGPLNSSNHMHRISDKLFTLLYVMCEKKKGVVVVMITWHLKQALDVKTETKT